MVYSVLLWYVVCGLKYCVVVFYLLVGNMPKILAFHPSLVLRVGESDYRVDCELDDWFPDAEVLHILHGAYGSTSADELVRGIHLRGSQSGAGGLRAVRVRKV